MSLSDEERETAFQSVWNACKRNWVEVVLTIVVYAVFVFLANAGIALIAEDQSVQMAVRNLGIQTDTESLRTVIAFFLKNSSVIPFTIVWMYHGLYQYLATANN